MSQIESKTFNRIVTLDGQNSRNALGYPNQHEGDSFTLDGQNSLKQRAQTDLLTEDEQNTLLRLLN